MNPTVVQAQQGLVRCIASGAPANWVEFVGHFEIDAVCENVLGSFLCDAQGHLAKVDAMEPGRINYQLYDAARVLWDVMNHEWNSMTARVDNSGRFKFAYSDALVRLSDNGDIGFNPTKSLIANILATYPSQTWDDP